MEFITKNLFVVTQINTLCQACRRKAGKNECQICHRLFCKACTPSHLAEEEQEIEERRRLPALKKRGVRLLQKLEMVQEKVLSFLSKLKGDIEEKIAQAEKDILLIEKLDEVRNVVILVETSWNTVALADSSTIRTSEKAGMD